MTNPSPSRHSPRYYLITGTILTIAAVLGFIFIDEASWALVIVGCLIGGFLADGIADLVRTKRANNPGS
ncbi:hypothetical protein [Actinokineospora sp. UTMC 2448]|uniref:hypothetical protein n=1 Tax=Actinokineospora sp. UTMC 2448 TaxID=2268449 RepID=UPI002164CC32|nr:hypothetical protein [Actinokineospora sp. UTMC 2448]